MFSPALLRWSFVLKGAPLLISSFLPPPLSSRFVGCAPPLGDARRASVATCRGRGVSCGMRSCGDKDETSPSSGVARLATLATCRAAGVSVERSYTWIQMIPRRSWVLPGAHLSHLFIAPWVGGRGEASNGVRSYGDPNENAPSLDDTSRATFASLSRLCLAECGLMGI